MATNAIAVLSVQELPVLLLHSQMRLRDVSDKCIVDIKDLLQYRNPHPDLGRGHPAPL